ncbi:monovalent cation/H+ antiporter complex subunit F [Isoptericola croceus]|uniref:monovalent cation/H+ antiporter complex subunit F n=1 Tax=Isoptericola croceus TaxID=3031406 RepID=UPI0023F71504|nr:monovalent cation/H+ antiporter complex subunit F [Isoptericola croceus]
MIVLWTAATLIVASLLAAVWRILVGPDDANRAVAADLLFFAVIALIGLVGAGTGATGTFDLVLVASLTGFLAAVSLARALTRGKR